MLNIFEVLLHECNQTDTKRELGALLNWRQGRRSPRSREVPEDDKLPGQGSEMARCLHAVCTLQRSHSTLSTVTSGCPHTKQAVKYIQQV